MKKSTKIFFSMAILAVVGLTGVSFAKAQIDLWLPDFKLDKQTIDNSDSAKEKEINIDPIFNEIPACGTPITDRDGYSYNTVEIGDQCWLAENLKTKTKSDGTCINGGTAPCADASSADNGKGRSCYNNNEALCTAEGALYTFSGIGGNVTTPGVQGICPDGWHIPTHNELTTLERSACTSGTCATDFPYDTTTSGARGTNEGIALRTGGHTGFNAVLGGRREGDGVTFTNRGNSTWLWSSQYAVPSVYRRLITASTGQIFRDAGNLTFNRAQSLRCLRDVPVTPSCGNTVTDRDGFTYPTVQIGNECWLAENLKTKTNSDGTCINKGMTSTVNGHIYTVGPAPDCKIYDNGVETNKGGWTVNQALTSKRDCISPTADQQGIEQDCASGYTLYDWHAALGDSATNPILIQPGQQSFTRQGICPTGWHIPTSDEFTNLERSVCTSGTCATDFPYGISTIGDRGTNEGIQLRLGGTSGFNALPIGQRRPHPTDTTQPAVFYKYPATFLWVSSFDGTYNQAGRRIVYGSEISDKINRKYTYKFAGYGVRCVKN